VIEVCHTVEEGLVTKDHVTKATIVSLSPERIVRSLSSERQHLTCLVMNVPSSKNLAESLLALSSETLSLLDSLRKLRHATRDAAVDDEDVVLLDPVKRHRGVEELDISIGELICDFSKLR
jgi:hypothetical protein